MEISKLRRLSIDNYHVLGSCRSLSGFRLLSIINMFYAIIEYYPGLCYFQIGSLRLTRKSSTLYPFPNPLWQSKPLLNLTWPKISINFQ